MFQSYAGFNIPYPELSSLYNNILKDRDRQNELAVLIEEQYADLKCIGVDYMEDTYIEDETLERLLIFVDKFYIPIANLETILDSSDHKQLFGRALYSFLCIDLRQTIIPKLLNLFKMTSVSELKFNDVNTWKIQLLNSVKSRLDNLRFISATTGNDIIKFEVFKYTFYIDLIDSDISECVDRFILPMINQHDTYLNSTIN